MTTADLPKFTNEESTRSGTAFSKDLLDSGSTSLPGELESHPETCSQPRASVYAVRWWRMADGV